jgi:hypothetical protein
MDRYSFLVRLLPPLLHSGLSRRTNIALSLTIPSGMRRASRSSTYAYSIGTLGNGDVDYDSSAANPTGSQIMEVTQTADPQIVWQMNTTGSYASQVPLFTVTVTVTVDGKRDSIINGAIHFTSSDPAAVLPANYGFTRADAGTHTWTNAFTLMTRGNQTISASIADISGINGTVNVTVAP